MKTTARKTHKIDASGKVLGRLAVEIAVLLRGKNKPDFAPHRDSGDIVLVKNVAKMKLTGRKIKQKKYYRHSGYPGGLKEVSLEKMMADSPGQVLKKAVFGMLPKNKLRHQAIKRLKIENEKNS